MKPIFALGIQGKKHTSCTTPLAKRIKKSWGAMLKQNKNKTLKEMIKKQTMYWNICLTVMINVTVVGVMLKNPKKKRKNIIQKKSQVLFKNKKFHVIFFIKRNH